MRGEHKRDPSERALLHAARDAVAFTADNMWACLEVGHWAPEDVDRHLRDAIAMLDRLDGGGRG